MLSKKMTVSLMSLITILAFAFIAASPAVANKVTLSLYDGNYLTTDLAGDTLLVIMVRMPIKKGMSAPRMASRLSYRIVPIPLMLLLVIVV